MSNTTEVRADGIRAIAELDFRPTRDLLEAVHSAAPGARQSAVRKLLAAIRAIPPSHQEEAAAILRQIVQADLDYPVAMMVLRELRELKRKPVAPLKLAILGSFTTHQLADLIRLYLFALGIDAEIYESDYSVLHQEIADPSSGLYEFRPDVLFLAASRRSLAHLPSYQDSSTRVRELIDMETARWSGLWHTAQERLGCQILQNNFDVPPVRILQNHEMRHPAGLGRYISLLNLALEEAAPPFVTIHDVDALSAAVGRWEWADEQFYYHAKLPCAPDHLVGYAHSVASVIGAHRGKSRKALVLDLDNTLWGGVIGDDGMAGIRCGQGDAEGEAFLAFQRYAGDLRKRGVILAVCSKNDEKVAREVFEKHAGMCLRLDDISCFVANWEDKASNIRRIAEQLEIGLDSLVFVDDNPAERALVRRFLPQVAVPELPEDPAGYVRAVERHGYFQTVSLGAEDLQRTEMYHANGLRQQAQSATANVEEFLNSLDMKAKVEPVTALNLERVAQLMARSNQFNLTTRRHSAADLMAMSRNEEWLTFAVSLSDCFGDNGLISVLVAKIDGEKITIDSWLMSCRVLKRGVEQFLLNTLAAAARQRKIRSILGEYIPTKKNGLVRDHYAKLGFEMVSTEDDGHSWWRLNPADAEPIPTCISRELPHE